MALQQKLARMVLACGMACAIGMAIGAGVGALPGTAGVAFAQAAEEGSTEDVLIFKNGTRVTGTIVSETATAIKFKSSAGGIAFETEYQKSEIIEIKRATKKAESGNAGSTPSSTNSAPVAEASNATDTSGPKMYVIPLRGEFGEDVSQKPILQALRDAKAQGASIIVLEMDTSTATQMNPYTGERMALPDQMAWNYVRRAEQIFPVFNTNLKAEWTNPPRVAMVLKRATGAAAFFPFAFKEIYFSPSGVWGGIGTLGELFSGVGDEPVQEKQKSLRLGHVEGWAIYGGYDYRLVRAMSRREYVLTMKFEGGKPNLLERMPEDPSEELLTDDGVGASQDSVRDMIATTGDDVLTLTPRIAQLLGVSKGTVSNQVELLSAMGVDPNTTVIRDRGDRIMRQWSQSMDNAKGQLRKLMEEYGEVRVEPPADYDARTKARGLQLNKLRQVKSILNRFDEGLSDWAGQNIPGIPMIETRIKEIELEQSLDRRD